MLSFVVSVVVVAFQKSAPKKYLSPYMPDFIYAMIKILSLSPPESINLVNNGLKKEIIEVKKKKKCVAFFINFKLNYFK